MFRILIYTNSKYEFDQHVSKLAEIIKEYFKEQGYEIDYEGTSNNRIYYVKTVKRGKKQ